jgi:hypothetical protein
MLTSKLFNPVVKHLLDAHGRWYAIGTNSPICFLMPMIDAAFLIVEGHAYETRTFDGFLNL